MVNTRETPCFLVGGFNHLEKYETMGRIIAYIMEKQKMVETTSQFFFVIFANQFQLVLGQVLPWPLTSRPKGAEPSHRPRS